MKQLFTYALGLVVASGLAVSTVAIAKDPAKPCDHAHKQCKTAPHEGDSKPCHCPKDDDAHDGTHVHGDHHHHHADGDDDAHKAE